jgi:hypothetical protein
MFLTSHCTVFTFLAVVPKVFAAIGPIADLHIVNADIAPDGLTRS